MKWEESGELCLRHLLHLCSLTGDILKLFVRFNIGKIWIYMNVRWQLNTFNPAPFWTFIFMYCILIVFYKNNKKINKSFSMNHIYAWWKLTFASICDFSWFLLHSFFLMFSCFSDNLFNEHLYYILYYSKYYIIPNGVSWTFLSQEAILEFDKNFGLISQKSVYKKYKTCYTLHMVFQNLENL